MAWSVLGETSMKYSEREDRKVPATAATTGKPVGRVPSAKKSPTFADHLKSSDKPEADVPAAIKPIEIQRQGSTRPGIRPSDSRRQDSMRSAMVETDADAWEEAELAKIKERFLFININCK